MYPAVSIRRRAGSVEEDFFTSSRSKSICAATLGWALICNDKLSMIVKIQTILLILFTVILLSY